MEIYISKEAMRLAQRGAAFMRMGPGEYADYALGTQRQLDMVVLERDLTETEEYHSYRLRSRAVSYSGRLIKALWNKGIRASLSEQERERPIVRARLGEADFRYMEHRFYGHFLTLRLPAFMDRISKRKYEELRRMFGMGRVIQRRFLETGTAAMEIFPQEPEIRRQRPLPHIISEIRAADRLGKPEAGVWLPGGEEEPGREPEGYRLCILRTELEEWSAPMGESPEEYLARALQTQSVIDAVIMEDEIEGRPEAYTYLLTDHQEEIRKTLEDKGIPFSITPLADGRFRLRAGISEAELWYLKLICPNHILPIRLPVPYDEMPKKKLEQLERMYGKAKYS